MRPTAIKTMYKEKNEVCELWVVVFEVNGEIEEAVDENQYFAVAQAFKRIQKANEQEKVAA